MPPDYVAGTGIARVVRRTVITMSTTEITISSTMQPFVTLATQVRSTEPPARLRDTASTVAARISTLPVTA